MAGIAYPELTFWLGIGLWGLLVLCAGGILLTVLTGHTAGTLPHAAKEPQSPAYQRAA